MRMVKQVDVVASAPWKAPRSPLKKHYVPLTGHYSMVLDSVPTKHKSGYHYYVITDPSLFTKASRNICVRPFS